MSVFSFPARTVMIDSALVSDKGIPFTPWIPAIGVSDIRAVVRIRDIEDTDVVEATAAYQTATTDTDAPDAWTTFGSAADATTPDRFGRDSSPSLSGKNFIRFGVLVQNTTGQNDKWKRAQITFIVSGRG